MSPSVSRAAFAAPLLDRRVEARELRERDRGLEIGQTEVRPGRLVLVTRAHAVIAQQLEPVGQRVVVGGDHATFAGRDVLRGVEGVRRQSEAARIAARHRRAVRLGRVLDDLGPVPLRDVGNTDHVRHLAVEMHGHDHARAIGAHLRE